jgi:hypothetical protein
MAAAGYAADIQEIFYFVPQFVRDSDIYQSYTVSEARDRK